MEPFEVLVAEAMADQLMAPSDESVEVVDEDYRRQFLAEEALRENEEEASAESPEGPVNVKRPRLESSPEPPEESKSLNVSDTEQSQTCPICMDFWHQSGKHRLCSLRCGHLFGHSCVLKWLRVGCAAGARRCPQCNVKAAVRDIRVLYACKLTAIDNSEVCRLRQELQVEKEQKKQLKREIFQLHIREKVYSQQLASMSAKMLELEHQQSTMHQKLIDGVAQATGRKFFLEETHEVSAEKGCRVMDYSVSHRSIAISHIAKGPLHFGFSIRTYDLETSRFERTIVLHKQPIRDVAFHPTRPELLMSVSFDKTAKLVDNRFGVIVHTYRVESQLWSCCWSTRNDNYLWVGSQNGTITEFDTRRINEPIRTLPHPGDCSPVVSLAPVSAGSPGMIGGGFIATHLNTCYAYELDDYSWTENRLPLDGPFIAARYDQKNNHALISGRPNSKMPMVRHNVVTIDQDENEQFLCNVIHTFNGGPHQKIISRPCHVNVNDDTLVAAYKESALCIPLWSVSSGEEMCTIPLTEPILDTTSFQINNKIILATLSADKLELYNYR